LGIPHPLHEELATLLAERFRLLSEPMRLRILDQLRDGPLTVGELTDRLGTSQQNVSKHLGQLRAGGLVERDKRGTCVAYAVADEGVFALCEHVCGRIGRQLEDVRALLPQPVAS